MGTLRNSAGIYNIEIGHNCRVMINRYVEPIGIPKLGYSKRSIAFFLVCSILLAAVVLFFYSGDFFREYTDERQSSLGSADMHNLAWASFHNKDILDGLFLAKRIGANGVAADYPHYTNGYPLLVGSYYQLVGDSLISSRLFPIFSITFGGLLFLLTLVLREGLSPAIFLSIPFLLASSIGRDAGSFELLEPAHFLALGVASYFLFRKNSLLIKFIAILISIALYQVSFIFIGAVIIAWYFRSKNFKELIILFAFLASSMLLVLVVFASSSGWLELFSIIKKRSGLNIEGYGVDESINLGGYIKSIFNIRLNQSVNYVILAGAILECIFEARNKKYLLPCVVASLLIYSVIFLNHTGAHYFTYLIYVYLILVAWIALLMRGFSNLLAFSNNAIATCILTIFLVTTFYSLISKPRNYREDPIVQLDYYALKKWVANNDSYRCSTFEVIGVRTDARIVSPFFAKYFGKNKTGPHCKIDLAN